MREAFSKWTEGPQALPAAGAVGFLENTFIVLPMEPIFIPMMIARGKRAWQIAVMLLIGNVIGGLLLYGVAMWADDAILQPAFQAMGATETYQTATEEMKENAFTALFATGITPMPFQVGAAAAGAAAVALPVFLAAVLISRAIRYFAVAGVVTVLGYRAEKWLDKYEWPIFIGGVVVFVLIGLFMVLR